MDEGSVAFVWLSFLDYPSLCSFFLDGYSLFHVIMLERNIFSQTFKKIHFTLKTIKSQHKSYMVYKLSFDWNMTLVFQKTECRGLNRC